MPAAPIEPWTPAAAIIAFSALFVQPLQFLVPTFLISWRFPKRDGFARRCALALAAVLLFNVAATMPIWASSSGRLPAWALYPVNFCVYTLYLAVLVPALRFCFDMGVWDALFCATAGYTVQNLGSGAAEFIRILLQAVSGRELGQLATAILSDCTVAVVIAICYLALIRRMRSLGKLGKGSRGVLSVFIGAILVVIAFDVVIRGLGREGAPWAFLLVLRVIHTAVSFFVLFAEYELLYRERLKGEIAARRLLSEEHARQYQMSRDTIEAVNRRVHDIRHQLMRELADEGPQVSHELLKSIVRGISVYDTSVKTGNEALDTILTEKSLACRYESISLSCIADGTALAAMPAADLYALFSGLLDEAIGEVCGLEDERLRSISLTLRRVGELALLHIEHYSGREAPEAPAFVSEIVTRHGGALASSAHDGMASIDAMLPIRVRGLGYD